MKMIEFTVYLIDGGIETYRVRESLTAAMMRRFDEVEDIYDYSYKEVIL